jgi:two-component system, LytTR family, response regulator
VTAIRAFLVDDEPLALARLERLLAATGRVAIVGRETDPEAAVAALASTDVDVLFLDIQMPGLSGFELLARLAAPPPVVFTTAFDEHALAAFATSSVDYLLKPITPADLERALTKLERLERRVIDKLAAALGARPAAGTRPPDRIASRLGSKTRLIEVARITHFFAEDKLTFAVVDGKDHVVDASIAELETRLGDGFFRIHRKTLVNLAFVAELDGGAVRLSDATRTELTVARDRVTPLKAALGI